MTGFLQRGRSRSYLTGYDSWNYKIGFDGRKTGSASYGITETCWDVNHGRGWRRRGSNVGGPLWITRKGQESVTFGASLKVGNEGSVKIRPGTIISKPNFTDATKLSPNSLWSYGARGVAGASPMNPSFSLPQFIGELREGVPKLIGHATLRDQTSAARKAGKEYLNVEFGWRPLISDLKAAGKLIVNSHEIRSQFIRDSGRPVQRRWTGPQDMSSSTLQTTGFVVAGGEPGVGAQVTYDQTYSSSIWFEGEFRYYIPEGNDIASRWERWNLIGRRMMGLSVYSAPETVWNLAPWTWLADWGGDAGALLTNVANLGGDSTQMTRGYVMHHSRKVESARYTVNPTGTGIFSQLKGPSTCGYVYVSENKQREFGSPFGFGLREVDLSNRQKAILGAIGLTTDMRR